MKNRNRHILIAVKSLGLVVILAIALCVLVIAPNLDDAIQQTRQRRASEDLRAFGDAWFSWLTDQVGVAAAGTNTYSISGTVITSDELLSTLQASDPTSAIQLPPAHDPWGNPYELTYSGSPLADQVIQIRCFGRDGKEGPTKAPYPMGPFVATAYDEDIVWADGFYIRYPALRAPMDGITRVAATVIDRFFPQYF